MTMRVLVCGGRDYRDWRALSMTLDAFHTILPITVLIHGGARGADSLAGEWALRRGVDVVVYRADWAGLGRSAGMVRNRRMLVDGKPDRVVAFPGGRGTANMVQLARDAGVPVQEIA